MSKQAIVIGAGPGGLSTAMLLASAGLKVRIFERLPHVGGRTSTLEAQNFKFDLGPTFFLYPRVLEEIYGSVGYKLNEELDLKRLDPQYRILFGGGGELNCTPDVARMEAEIARLNPSDAPGFSRFLEDNRRKFELFRPCIEHAFLSLRDVINTRMLKMLPQIKPHLSVESYLRKYFKDPRVRLAFSFQSKYLGMSPFQCPSLFSILSFLEYEYGVFHPIGGCGAITSSMARIAEGIGVEISLNDPVQEIIFAGKKAIGVRTDSGSHFADAVVINADFGRAMERLVPDKLRPRWSNKKLQQKKFSCSTFMMYLGLDGRDNLPHHTIYIAENYEKNLEDIETRHVLSDDPSLYVQNAAVTDPTVAPKGQSALYLLAPVTHQHANVDWNRERDSFRKTVLKQAAKAGFTDLEKRIRYERIITPQDWDQRYEVYRGATFNLSHSLGQLLHLRPKNRFEGVDGVYLVGGGTHPGSGLPVIFESARITSKLLLNDLGVKTKIKNLPEQLPSIPAAA
ncbi:MAG: phytoene desaturase family protein [Limisphaerales bacterium]